MKNTIESSNFNEKLKQSPAADTDKSWEYRLFKRFEKKRKELLKGVF